MLSPGSRRAVASTFWRQWFSLLIGLLIGWLAFSPKSWLTRDLSSARPTIDVADRSIVHQTAEGKSASDAPTKNRISPDAAWPKIFCMINSIPGHQSRRKAVNDTWVKHCDGHIYVSTKLDDTKEPASEFWTFNFTEKHAINSHIWIWDRLRASIRRLEKEKGNEYDWFLKADDDTFAVIENLKEALKGLNPDEPLYMGAMLKYMDQSLAKRPRDFIYPSGGSGYVLSRGGLKKFVEVINESNGEKCRNTTYLHEDTEVGWCLQSAKVAVLDSVDLDGKHRMLPIDVMDIIHPTRAESHSDRGWARQSLVKTLAAGPDCCSPHIITIHYVSDMLMYTYYYLVYDVIVPGRLSGD
ncbi:unnamed protein product, partial [Mesorhabditis spiculigera]